MGLKIVLYILEIFLGILVYVLLYFLYIFYDVGSD